MTGARTSEPRNLQLRTLHLEGYRWATAAELRAERERRAHLARPIRNGDQPFLVADLYGPTRRGDDANDAAMWRDFVAADGQDDLLRFAEVWGMPAGFDVVQTSRSLAVPWPTLKRAQEAFKTATHLLTARDDGALADVVRFHPPQRAWEVLVWTESWGLDWSLVPPELAAGAPADPVPTLEASRRIATAVATSALSELIYAHTRNVLAPSAGLEQPEMHRLSDPIGGMALYMAEQLGAGKPLKRCELDTCRRLFYPGSRSDQRFCTKGHGTSASNRRRTRRAAEAARP